MKASKNLDPYLLCIGTPAIISSCVVICNKKVVTEHISKNLLACLFVLLAIYYSYNLEYNAVVKPALEFLQEKLLNDRLPPSRKVTRSYEQLYRAIDCMEQKMEISEPEDEDATQFEVEYVQ